MRDFATTNFSSANRSIAEIDRDARWARRGSSSVATAAAEGGTAHALHTIERGGPPASRCVGRVDGDVGDARWRGVGGPAAVAKHGFDLGATPLVEASAREQGDEGGGDLREQIAIRAEHVANGREKRVRDLVFFTRQLRDG